MKMTSEKLNYILTLAEEKNITRAAGKLFITQPTLTGYLNRLEKELGVKIFDRTHTPVVLTRSGEEYVRRMQQLLRDEQKLIEDLRYMESPHKQLSIGIGYVHSQLWSADLLTELTERYPQLDIQLVESREGNLIEALKKGTIDLFVGHFTIDTARFRVVEVFTSNLVLLVPKQFLTEKGYEKVESSPENPFVLPEPFFQGLPVISPNSSQGLYLNFRTFMEQFHIHPSRIIQTASMATGIQLAARGLGYIYIGSGMMDLLSPELRKNLTICTLQGLASSRKDYCAYSETNVQAPLIREVIAIFKKQRNAGIQE